MIAKLKSTLEGFNSRLDEAEECVIVLEDKAMEITQTEKQKEKKNFKKLKFFKGFWDNIRWNNILSIGVPEREEGEKGPATLFEETMTENFPNLRKDTDTQVQEAKKFPNRMNPKRSTPRCITLKMGKNKYKEKILKAAREKQLLTYKVRLLDFSTETLQARREWHDIFHIMKGKNFQEFSTWQGYHSESKKRSRVFPRS